MFSLRRPAVLVLRSNRAMSSAVGALVDAAAAGNPLKDLFAAPHQQLVWSVPELVAQSNALAAGLIENGYQPGSKLALWLTNDTEHAIAQLAAAKAGVVVVSIDPKASTSNVVNIIKDEGCRGLMFASRFNGEHRMRQLNEAFPELQDGVWGDNVSTKRARNLRHLITTGLEEPLQGFLQYKNLPVYNATPDPVARVQSKIEDAAPLAIPYKAGADGSVAASAAVSQTDLVKAAKNAAAKLQLTSTDVVGVAAWQHTWLGFACGTLASLHAGAKTVLLSRAATPAATLDLLAKNGVTVLVTDDEHAAELAAANPKSYKLSLRTGLTQSAVLDVTKFK